ncbi:YHS domain-containing (seleno)protein [Thermostichus vulcanus]|uniref:YHS domain-containing (seleno)protein n=1 Tax=Thermostichus vulcanus TaxID=32053 RepID=UPI001FCC65CB|nr:YHS domain-containing (seleno)protein [Thermostichus vulcanus]
MRKTQWIILSALLAVGIGAASLTPLQNPTVQAQTTVMASEVGESSDGPFFATEGLAIRGYDPVAYFIDAQPVQGSAAHEWEWGGVTWRFANADNLQRFRNNPERFAPQYGGFCAWAVAHNYLYPVDPFAWRIVDDKLYLNANQRVQRNWERDIPGFIEKADLNWPELRTQ